MNITFSTARMAGICYVVLIRMKLHLLKPAFVRVLEVFLDRNPAEAGGVVWRFEKVWLEVLEGMVFD